MNTFIKRAISVVSIFPLAAKAQTTADDIKVHDTRYLIDSPSAFNQTVRFDFKERSTVGAPGRGTYSGQLTIAPWLDNSGGWHHQLNFNDGGIFYRTGRPDAATWNSWQRLVLENASGNVGIGTTSPDEKLSVNGRIRAKEVKVEVANWPDYVFNDDYDLLSVAELEKYIEIHGHLPAIPAESEVKANGIRLGEMNAKLLEKIEELTLYLLQQSEKLEQQQTLIEQQQKQINAILSRLPNEAL